MPHVTQIHPVSRLCTSTVHSEYRGLWFMPYADAAKVTPLGRHWPMEQWGDNKGNLIKMHPHSRNKLLLAFLEDRAGSYAVLRYVLRNVWLCRLHCQLIGAFLFIYGCNFQPFYRLPRRHYYVITSRVILIFFAILNATNFHIQYPVLHKVTNRGWKNDGTIKMEKQAKNAFSSKSLF